MMSGDDRENDKQTEQSDDVNKRDEVQNASDAPDVAPEAGVLSSQSEKKSYPFSLPGEVDAPGSPQDDAQEAREPVTGQQADLGSGEAAETPEEAPAVEDIVSALEPEDMPVETAETEMPQEQVHASGDQQQEDVPQEALTAQEANALPGDQDQDEEDIEAALDEGLFSNEVLPDEGIERELEQVTKEEPGLEPDEGRDGDEAAQNEVHDGERGMQAAKHAGAQAERREPYMAQTTTSQGSAEEGPRHAFDTGEPALFEDENSQQVKKKSGMSAVLVSFIILFLLAGVVIGGGFFYVKLKFEAPGSQPQQLSHVIKPKQGLKEIASDLADKGIIEDKNIFMIGSYISGQNKSLKAGEFEFAPNLSMKEVLDTIAKGKVIQHKITLAEGLTSQQIVEIINDNPVLTGEIDTLPAEGSLLPETYQFTRGMTRQQIIDRMQKAQKELVEKLWPRRADKLGVVTPADAITLASIVEKETGLSNERARVAAVFNNRLNNNMRLQSDPTVIYGIVGGEGKLDRPIRRSDLEEQTAYNTYKIDGLPPTPIANPGKASIEAVLRPARTDDLYFVADGTGGHAFATSLKQHNENVARWRKIESGVEAPPSSAEESAKSVAADTAGKTTDKKDTPSKPVQELKAKAEEKAGALQKTIAPKNDAKSIAQTPEKTDKVLPKAKPVASAPDVVKEATENKESLTEKVRAIFVKPEEAPLPRSKPNALLQQGIDKINVTPLPEQNVPTAPRITPPPSTSQQSAPQTLQQTTQPGGEPTPELETNRPSRAPVQRPFNPFEE